MKVVRPPGWGFFTAVAIAAFTNLWWSSVPFPYLEGTFFGFFVWVPLGLYWLIRLLLAVGTQWRTWSVKRSLRWLAAPLIVAGVWAAIHLDVSFAVRFALSRPGMQQYAESIIAGGERADPGCRWTGLYHVCGRYLGQSLDVAPAAAELYINDGPLASTRCFVWAPGGRPASEDYEYGLRHLSGSWWGCRGWDGW
ncbi:hypothetical protein ACFFMN_35125 [Planobispora siamensis]|uniref:Uncharacterized protein n=1 Tax=Planobispora siamensis TaxID=936338 RepID=A0A8J3SVZ8_9ACTN|nr:hypothetical protein [Planobispora siamensis]GIH96553.1 hypothetical protein Psi01_71830 [Planobispora siamensis]